MTTFSEELRLAKQAYDVYYIEEAREHIEKALILDPDNIEAMEINTWIAFHSDISKAKQLAESYLAKKQNLPLTNDLTNSDTQLLASASTELTPEISLLLASRYFGNAHNQFKSFLQSLLKHTKDISILEIILRIDLDDDIDFFKKQLNNLPKKVQWKLLGGARGKGFLDRTTYLWQAMDFVHPDTHYLLPLSDNAIFVKQNWDSINNFHLKRYSRLKYSI